MDSKKLILIIILFIAISFTITGCFLPNQEENSGIQGSQSKYYTGKVGVEAEFSNLPKKVWYYEGGSPTENVFDFTVKVHNKGTSLARGATFISGYGPSFLEVEGQDLQRQTGGDCVIDITSFGNLYELHTWNGLLSCAFMDGSSFEYTRDEDFWTTNINNIGNILGQLGIWDTPNWIDNLDLSLTGEDNNLLGFGFNFDNLTGLDINLLYHGAGLSIAMAEAINFENYFGREYILAADNSYFPGGGSEYIGYHVDMKYWPPGAEEYELPLMLTNCYGYATYTAPMLCIDPMPESEQRKACKPKDIHMTNQGAPVAVTKIEQEGDKKRVRFTIHVKNVGDGEVIDWGHIARCSPYYTGPLMMNHKNLVQGFVVNLENQRLECTPSSGNIRLNDQGEGQITCTYNIQYQNLQSAYQTPLVIEFWYGYQQTEIQSILFKKI